MHIPPSEYPPNSPDKVLILFLARESRYALVAAAPLMDHIGNIGVPSLRRPPSLAGIEGH